jgi:type IV pilus assembly protein PilW
VSKRRFTVNGPTGQTGLTLLELMVSIVLGLLVVAATLSVYVGHRNSYALVEGAGRVQENVRFAAEILSRELREAGGIACGGNLSPVYHNNVGTWGQWDRGLVGNVLGAGVLPAPPASLAGSDSVLIWSATGDKPFPIVSHDAAAGTFVLGPAAPGQALNLGGVAVACDGARVYSFPPSPASTASYATANANITDDLRPGGFVAPLSAHLWFVGPRANNAVGTALRRAVIDHQGVVGQNEELIENVSALTLSYLSSDSPTQYSSAAEIDAIPDGWKHVLAVRVGLTVVSQDSVATATTGAQPLSEAVTFTVTLRRRAP